MVEEDDGQEDGKEGGDGDGDEEEVGVEGFGFWVGGDADGFDGLGTVAVIAEVGLGCDICVTVNAFLHWCTFRWYGR